MYSKEGTIHDRREMLKVKIKSLAAETRVIRKEELRLLDQANPGRPAYRKAYDAEYYEQFSSFLKDRKGEELTDDAFAAAEKQIVKEAAKQARIAAKLARAKMRRPASINPIREELYLHRIHIVRREARAAHIAYMLIKGWCYSDIEPTCKPYNTPDWMAVSRLCQKYGPSGYELVDRQRLAPKVIKGAIAAPSNH